MHASLFPSSAASNSAIKPWPLTNEFFDSSRLARIRARHHFVQLKLAFMRASADVEGELGVLLQRRVRLAERAEDLWRLRGVLLGALPPGCEGSAMHHRALQCPAAMTPPR